MSIQERYRVEIEAFNRGVTLLMSDDEWVRSIHRAPCKLGRPGRADRAYETQGGGSSVVGRLASVQPRIRLSRSFDERSHSYLGYVLWVEGTIGGDPGVFLIALGKAAHQKHRFQPAVKGQAVPVPDPWLETAGFYKASGLKVLKDVGGGPAVGPPFLGGPPDLETYRNRGHRRLATKTYDAKCRTCIWGCWMPVEMIVDHWNPAKKQYRLETFCYGPKSCSFYQSGLNRKVPGRKGMP